MTNAEVSQRIYQRIAEALARLQVPDFTPAEAPDVARAMQAVIPFGAAPDPDWVAALLHDICQLSNGTIEAEPIDPSEFPGPLSKGPALYLRLRSDTTRHAYLGDYMPPVHLI